MVFDEIVDEEEAVVVALVVVDGEVVTIRIQSLDHVRPHDSIDELVTCAYIHITRW